MRIDVQAFLEILPYIGKGMLGIFIVTAVVVACMVILNRVTAKKE